MRKSPWFITADAVAAVVVVLLILDPTRDLGPVLGLLAAAGAAVRRAPTPLPP
jgi:hypothetical protein